MNTGEYRDDDSQWLGTARQAPPAGFSRRHIDRPRDQTAAKFIQICASQDDLFALDEEGNIYQYNFSVKTWVTLVASRSYEERP